MDLYAIGSTFPPGIVAMARFLAGTLGLTPAEFLDVVVESAVAALWILVLVRVVMEVVGRGGNGAGEADRG